MHMWLFLSASLSFFQEKIIIYLIAIEVLFEVMHYIM
jgi:hypothetical protein